MSVGFDPAGLSVRIRAGEASLGVIGLGYVGLPICLTAAEAGMRVVGFDIDPSKPQRLARGESYFRHIDQARIRASVASGHFSATSDFGELGRPDVLLICVPTPINAHLEPDLSFIVATGAAIAKRLRRGQLVVLESTTYPGTTDEVLRPILEQSGLVCGRDFLSRFRPSARTPATPISRPRASPRSSAPTMRSHARRRWHSMTASSRARSRSARRGWPRRSN